MRRNTLYVAVLTLVMMMGISAFAAAQENLALTAKVTVDSAFSGYAPGTQLNDGELNEKDPEIDSSWGDVAWASAAVPGEHWIELELAKESSVGGISIYWAKDFGEYKTSSHIILQYWDGEGWADITEFQQPRPDTNLKSSQFTFVPVTTSKIRVLQPDKGGPVSRPDIMWVAEVQVWGE